MIYATLNQTFEAVISGAPEGEAPNLTVEVWDPTDSSTVLAASNSGIYEARPGTYVAMRSVGVPGTFLVRWELSGSPLNEEELVVAPSLLTLPSGGWVPSVAVVSTYLRARTKDDNSNELGTFNENTRPTGAEVEQCIAMAASMLVRCAGAWLPESLYQLSQTVIGLRAAMLIELSYWPEQLETNQSPYEHLRDLYMELQPTLCGLAADYIPDDMPSPAEGDDPLFYFGDGAYGSSVDVEYNPQNRTFLVRGERPVVWWLQS